MEYTPRVDGFQIRDVTYLGKPPKDAPQKYAVVKWKECKPTSVIDGRTGEPIVMTEYCYVVADLVWNTHEPCFEIEGVGLRLLEARPSDAAIDMILDFCEKKSEELLKEEC